EIITKSPIDGAAKDLLVVKTRLAERAELPPGPKRSEAEAEAFRHVERLRASEKPEARLALLAMARALETPEETMTPEAWDMLAEGHLALGHSDRAATLE